MVLATVTVFFRDMEYLWDVVLMIIMYTCAIFYYPQRLLKSGFSWLLKYNPLYCVIHNFRACFLGDPLNWNYMLYAFVFSVFAILIGTYTSIRNRTNLFFIFKETDMGKEALIVDDVSMKFNLSSEKVDNIKEYIIKSIKRQISMMNSGH